MPTRRAATPETRKPSPTENSPPRYRPNQFGVSVNRTLSPPRNRVSRFRAESKFHRPLGKFFRPFARTIPRETTDNATRAFSPTEFRQLFLPSWTTERTLGNDTFVSRAINGIVRARYTGTCPVILLRTRTFPRYLPTRPASTPFALCSRCDEQGNQLVRTLEY